MKSFYKLALLLCSFLIVMTGLSQENEIEVTGEELHDQSRLLSLCQQHQLS